MSRDELLWKGSDWVVTAASRVAHRFGVSDLVIGLTVVALGTSAPEIVVTLVAAARGAPDIAVANVVGSNVFNLCFILGLCALVWTVPTSHHLVRRDTPLLLMSAALLFVFLSDDLLSPGEGLTMIAVLGIYVVYLFWHKTDDLQADVEEIPEGSATWRDFPLLLVGLAAVLWGAHWLVRSAVDLSSALAVPQWAIGMTLVAGGTSLPELAVACAAASRGRPGIVAGNLIGSDLHNVLGVLGLAALVQPLSVSGAAQGSVLMMIGMIGVLVVFMRSGWRLSRVEGCLLMGIGILRWGRDLSIPGISP